MNYKDFFDLAKLKGIEKIQVTENTSNQEEIEFIDEKLENYNSSYHTEYSVKAEKNKKTEKLTTDYLAEDIIDLLLLKLDNTDSNYKDEYLENKEKIEIEQEIPKLETTEEYEILSNLYKAKEKHKNISKITSYYLDDVNKIRITNNNGVDISSISHTYQFIVEILIEEKDNIISYSKKAMKTDKSDIDFNKITNNAIEEAEIMLKREELETKKYDIILSSDVAGRILSHIAEMASGTSIRQKTSCLGNKLKEKIFSDKLTIIEEPNNKFYPGYRLFDNEGILTEKKYIVNKGVLETYLYNIKEAKLANKKSTGNGYNNISIRNMYINPGKKKEKEIISNIKEGIYITDYMGADTTSISATTGNISLQIFGFKIKNGKIECGFNPCIMTTTIFELFNNIAEVGSELEFTNKYSAAPVLYVKNISIAANN